MKTLKPELLTATDFKAYGQVIEAAGADSVSINSGNCLRYNGNQGIN